MTFVPFVPDEPQARKVVMYSAPPVKATGPIRTPIRSAVKVQHTCVYCSEPAKHSGGLCAMHYYFEAVHGRGKQWPGHGFIRRPGRWLPPIIAVVTVFLALAFIGSMAIFWCFFGPFFMYGWVFGMKNKSAGGGTGVPHMFEPQPMDEHWQDDWR